MTRSTSEVAVCWSRASASSRVRALTCSCRSARVEPAWRAAVGALLRSGFVVLACCVFAGLRPIARRRLTEPLSLSNDYTLAHREVRRAPQEIRCRLAATGHSRRFGIGRVSAHPYIPDILGARFTRRDGQ